MGPAYLQEVPGCQVVYLVWAFQLSPWTSHVWWDVTHAASLWLLRTSPLPPTQPLSPHTFSRYFLCQELGPQQHTGQNWPYSVHPKACPEHRCSLAHSRSGCCQGAELVSGPHSLARPCVNAAHPHPPAHPLQASRPGPVLWTAGVITVNKCEWLPNG